MDKAYKFLQVTLLGLIVGILIILHLQVNYWAYDNELSLQQAAGYQVGFAMLRR